MGAPIPVLIDADVLAYMHSSVGNHDEFDEEGQFVRHVIDPFDWLTQSLRNHVDEIQEACGSSIEPFMFLTGDTNFRNDVAKLKVYKGNRQAEKPYHLANMRAHIRGHYNTYLSKGCEADDLLAIAQTQYRKEGVKSIIATVDKDLLQVAGHHYRWEGYNFGETPVHLVDEFGSLEDKGKKVEGTGYIWFCYQILAGDNADNIPGLPGCGPKKAYKALCEAVTAQEAFGIVLSLYRDKYLETATQELTEQATLVWMVRAMDGEGKLVHFNLQEHIDGYKESS